VNKGWNLISLPVAIGPAPLATLFPHAVSQAWRWQGTYLSEDTPEPGKGYWVKFDSMRTVMLIGTPLQNDTIDVIAGWNLIGSISKAVSVDSVQYVPAEMEYSDFFDYNNSYQQANTIEPLHGYWIKVSQNGQLILTAPQSSIPQKKK
jgi:hypothetical protein